MTPIDECLQTLKLLIAVGNAHQIALAERAIDVLLAANLGPTRQADALNVLEGKLVPARSDATGQSADFADAVFGYIDQRLRDLTESP